MMHRSSAGAALALLVSSTLIAQTAPPEATSLLGRKLFALPDTDGTVKSARQQVQANPGNVTLVLKLSKALAAKRLYREAVDACTAGLITAPNSTDLYVERGHRQLGLRDFKSAIADLTRAVQLDPAQLDAHYHLGLAYYFLGQFAGAARSFGRALDLAKTSDSLIDCSNWLYVALRRGGQNAAAAQVLVRITPDIKNTEPHLFFYLQLLHFYQGKVSEAQILPPKPSGPADIEGELSFNTINYGVGNWQIYNNHAPKGKEYFEKVVTRLRLEQLGIYRL